MSDFSGKTVFVIGKPLQLMVSLCIASEFNFETKPYFMIVDSFKNAQNVALRLLNEFTNLQVPLYFPSRKLGFDYLKKNTIKNLFIDSDVGFRNYIQLARLKFYNPDLNVNVYEEGVGTYRDDLYIGVKRVIFEAMGVAVNFGGSNLVDKVYLFDKKEYIKNIKSNKDDVIQIKKNIANTLIENNSEMKRLFGFEEINKIIEKTKNCHLYLSDWDINKKFLIDFIKIDGDKFIKLHPHIKDELNIDGINQVSSGVPAELLLTELVNLYEMVYVYDLKSSVRRYINSSNIIYIHIG